MLYYRIKGGIYGHLIGDALSVQCKKQKKPPTTSSVLQLLARSYGDAGAMSLCTMSSIVENDNIDLPDIVYMLQEWYLGSYLAVSVVNSDSRTSISQSFRLHSNGMPSEKCGSKDETVDNSALIRMLPIALWNMNEDLETIVSQAHLITRFTNQQLKAQVCSALYCLLIRGFISQHKEKIVDTLEKYYDDNKMHEHLKTLNSIKEAKNSAFKGDFEVVDCFWRSWDEFSKNKKYFENAIAASLSLNTMGSSACVVGSYAGCNMGFNEIPGYWIDQLNLPEDAEKIIDSFISKIINKNN